MISSNGSEEEDFQSFPFFNQSEAMATIFDIGHGHETYFGRGPSKEYHIQV